ncbi:hypothetical protein [Mesorhizobium sp.]|uniref:hypothetical protein n=1 Tax=Mesorhizobium sp. TaxID=1871066 RepID=UPI000FEA1D32|nr:hypothetical protein [Mesorhizobium sp.]RWK41340.1 MAG: hypothetical protein EOR46_16900 [Mesorhizobium sp.]RWK67333.1 MAG: hypothetical protein EOR54_19525 [Mesorhizobium sp.]RWK74807.1 MAG: hypothetical protein EOR50_18720 [Mesorhizobium sp.]RWK77901.1 MAG: hypothetical protein EOR51_25270 [Mesorhizobium sp.]RWL03310.1 MAG: hypothetical protein EOR55_19215 [Mesorhizobium sp.]
MSKALTSFALVAILTALLMALSLAVARHGYPFGAIGAERLDDVADAGTFIPLAAVYFFSALLMMVLPIRVAGIVLTHAADAIFWTVIVLFAAIIGGLAARWAFDRSNVLPPLLNWRFLFVVAVVGCHLFMNELRRNILLRSLFFVVFAAATLACLFWSFTI